MEYGKRIYLRSSGRANARDAIDVNWLAFTRRADGIYVNARTSMLSWPDSRWKVSLSLLDSKGATLESAHSVLDNSGFISGIPRETVGDLRFILDTPKVPADKYRLQITLVPEDTPVTVKLEQFEIIEPEHEPSAGGRFEFDKPIPISLNTGAGDDPKVVQIGSITFHKKANSNIDADLDMTLKSWPKGKWQVAVLLPDRQGRAVEVSDVVFGNSGVVRGVGTIGRAHLHVTLISPYVPVDSFRVEIIPAPGDTPITANLDYANGTPRRP